MSVFTDLPESCRLCLDYRQPRQIRGGNLGQAGHSIDFTETWTQVPASEYVAFLDAVCGYVETFTTPLGSMARVVPLRHWEFDRFLALDFTAVAYGVGAESGGGLPTAWPFYRVTVRFGTPDYAMDGDKPFLTESVQPSARTIQLPASGARVGGKATVYDPGRTVHGQTYSLTAHQLPGLPIDVYRGFAGKTNADEFLGNPTGTVKYLGPSGESTSTWGSTSTFTVSHVFEISDLPWNYAANPDGTFSLKTYSDGSLEFPYSGFASLFS